MTHGPAATTLPRTDHTQTSVEDLFRRWQRDQDRHAREQLVTRYLPLAKKLARRYRGAHEPLDDLVQVASLGLVKAIDRYDPDRANGFQSYAVPTILGELKRYFRDCGWAVHVPRGTQERAISVEAAQRELTARSGRAPTFTELAEYLELSVEDVLDALEASTAHHAVSFDTPHDDGDGDVGTLGDSIGQVDERFELVDLGACIEKASKNLSERERKVLALRFLEDQAQTKIAEQIGVSQMQVSRILRKALNQLAEAVDDSAETAADSRPLARRRR
jgi:RNA polymerase sigma-B factor